MPERDNEKIEGDVPGVFGAVPLLEIVPFLMGNGAWEVETIDVSNTEDTPVNRELELGVGIAVPFNVEETEESSENLD